MDPEIESMLESVAEAVADGLPVDWDGLHAAEPRAFDQLKRLRLCQDILTAHRALVAPGGGGPA